MDIVTQLRELSKNLWWTWQPDLIALFRDIDPERWRDTNHNPVAFLSGIAPEKIAQAVKDQALEARVSQAFHRLEAYLQDPGTWGGIYTGPLHDRPIAYFSAEFGLHESLPVYSGGLGILAGDHLATASDFGLPLFGIGLFYARGYFSQRINADGQQQEAGNEFDVEELPLARIEEDGRPVCVKVEIGGDTVAFSIWRADVGRCSLILLDCNVEDNKPKDRELTDRLYEADPAVRIRQEAILGIGGIRALRQLGIRPSVLHLNEGHSAFCILERMREEVEENGVDFDEARRRVAQQTIFTTHTPVEAGHDRFAPELVGDTLRPLREKLGLSDKDFLALGQEEAATNSSFCMTTLALRLSLKANAVSALHGRTARHMWNRLWPNRSEPDVPIGHITNGVHISSWLAPAFSRFFIECLGPDWEQNQCSPATWAPIMDVDDEQLWEVHQILKARLMASLQTWIQRQAKRRDGDEAYADKLDERFQPNILTVAFARRFAAYKRADLIFSDEERLAALLGHEERPVQLIFAGKAHPSDEPGKEIIRRIFRLARSDAFKGRLLFLEDYDINIARHLVQGCDLWLNTPLRTREACGTSGMKAMFNGVLNLSVQDGWWAEAYSGTNGFSIGSGEAHADPERQRERDAESLYHTLEHDVVPLYYARDDKEVPRDWVRRMKTAIATLGWRFNADRMIMEYARELYLPAAGIKAEAPVQKRNPVLA